MPALVVALTADGLRRAPLRQGTTEGRAGRYLVDTLRCKVCALEQPVAPTCAGCATSFAEYYCEPCRLFAKPSVPGGIFHCEDCGICRVGLPEDFWHCETCGACYTVASRSTHVCVERALQSDCPVTPPDLQ